MCPRHSLVIGACGTVALSVDLIPSPLLTAIGHGRLQQSPTVVVTGARSWCYNPSWPIVSERPLFLEGGASPSRTCKEGGDWEEEMRSRCR